MPPVDPDSQRPNRKKHRLPMEVYATTAYEYFFTICARQQGTPFSNSRLADQVVDSLLWTREKHGWLLYCYCLMPDHLHFVCRLTDADLKWLNAGARGVVPEGVLDHLGRFKSFTTSCAWRVGYQGPLWQKSSYDKVLDMQRPFEVVVMYRLRNPERKGLVQDWQQYRHSKIVDPWWL